MSNPTSNFGWQMPTATDLVTDLPADFEVFGQAVDTALMDLKGGTTGQVLKKNTDADMDFVWGADSAGMTNPMTTTGDTIYSSSGSTPARLGIGSTGQVMTVSGGLPAWQTPAGASKTWTLLNTGGTALSGSSTVTVSGISDKDDIFVLVVSATYGSGGNWAKLRFNTDSGSNYRYGYNSISVGSTYSASMFNGYPSGAESSVLLATQSSNSASQVNAYLSLSGCKSTGVKLFGYTGGATHGGGNSQELISGGGNYNASAAITSVSLLGANSFTGGTLFVYGA
jgi:hypothetical protein